VGHHRDGDAWSVHTAAGATRSARVPRLSARARAGGERHGKQNDGDRLGNALPSAFRVPAVLRTLQRRHDCSSRMTLDATALVRR
jgi:hypothetical protein